MDDIAIAEHFLLQADPLLGSLIQTQAITIPETREDYFISLCRSIIGQQVSVASAQAIFGRFSTITKGVPLAVASLDELTTKEIGLSGQKASYLKDLAVHFVENPAVYDHLDQCSDEEVILDLTRIKGIGPWTAQMFLMFTLRRPDVFAPDDRGLQLAMQKLYGWEIVPAKHVLEEKAFVWKPYRTIASLHLWHSLKK